MLRDLQLSKQTKMGLQDASLPRDLLAAQMITVCACKIEEDCNSWRRHEGNLGNQLHVWRGKMCTKLCNCFTSKAYDFITRRNKDHQGI